MSTATETEKIIDEVKAALGDRLLAHKPLSVEYAYAVLNKVATGINAAHEAGRQEALEDLIQILRGVYLKDDPKDTKEDNDFGQGFNCGLDEAWVGAQKLMTPENLKLFQAKWQAKWPKHMPEGRVSENSAEIQASESLRRINAIKASP